MITQLVNEMIEEVIADISKQQRTTNIPMSAATMQRYITKHDQNVKKLVKEHYKDTEETVTNKKVSSSINQSQIDQEWQFELAELERVWVEGEFKPEYAILLGIAGTEMAKRLARAINERFTFNVTSGELVGFLNNWSVSISGTFNVTRNNALSNILKLAIEEGYSSKTTAGLMKGAINLTSREATFLGKKYKSFLDAGDSITIAKKKALRIATKLKDRRALRIAKTELARAYGEANNQAFSQAIQAGKISGAVKIWVRTMFDDRRNHDNSITNDGIMIPVNEAFPDGSMYPSEIGENCYLDYQVIQ